MPDRTAVLRTVPLRSEDRAGLRRRRHAGRRGAVARNGRGREPPRRRAGGHRIPDRGASLRVRDRHPAVRLLLPPGHRGRDDGLARRPAARAARDQVFHARRRGCRHRVLHRGRRCVPAVPRRAERAQPSRRRRAVRSVQRRRLPRFGMGRRRVDVRVRRRRELQAGGRPLYEARAGGDVRMRPGSGSARRVLADELPAGRLPCRRPGEAVVGQGAGGPGAVGGVQRADGVLRSPS